MTRLVLFLVSFKVAKLATKDDIKNLKAEMCHTYGHLLSSGVANDFVSDSIHSSSTFMYEIKHHSYFHNFEYLGGINC